MSTDVTVLVKTWTWVLAEAKRRRNAARPTSVGSCSFFVLVIENGTTITTDEHEHEHEHEKRLCEVYWQYALEPPFPKP